MIHMPPKQEEAMSGDCLEIQEIEHFAILTTNLPEWL